MVDEVGFFERSKKVVGTQERAFFFFFMKQNWYQDENRKCTFLVTVVDKC